MAKTIIKPAPMPDGPHPKGRHLLRIMFDDNEPPKNYIWAHPDGFFYRWETSRWVPININNPNDVADFIEDDSCDCNNDCGCNKSITRCDLDRILDRLKKDILSYTLKMIKDHSGDNEIERYLEEEILPRLTALTNRVSSLESDNTTNKNNISNLDERVQSLEAIDHDKFVTTDVLEGYAEEADLSPYATKNDLIGLATEEYVNNAIANVDDSDLRELVENNALVTSASLNDLNDRTTVLESAGFITEHQSLADYSTTSDVNSAIAAATTDMATQTWVEGNYEPKFTDLTGETDPEATAKTHTDDNKVYITEVIDTE